MAAPNVRQKTALLNQDANLKPTLDNYLTQGFVIHQIIPITVSGAAKVLIIYYDPAVDE